MRMLFRAGRLGIALSSRRRRHRDCWGRPEPVGGCKSVAGEGSL